MKNINFDKSYIWGMICIGNLIILTMAFKEINNYTYLLIINKIYTYFSFKPTVQN